METIIHKPLNTIWLKASVVGSIWASVEIILGSFLHNLKVPLSGMILSLISVWILISFIQIWKENGLIWRAGIICALMKSISPSAFILGPMIGIFTEAIIIDLIIFIFGKNMIGYLIGGSIAVLSTLMQKIVSLLILYGFDLIKIASDLYKYIIKQIDLEQLSPYHLLIVIAALYIITGAAASVAGYLAGSNYLKSRDKEDLQSQFILQPKNQLFSQDSSQSYSVLFLVINLISIAGILLLINSEYIFLAVIISLAYVGFCIYNYKNSLKRLKKLSFWVSFLIITFAASFLWNGFQEGVFFSLDGLIIGLKMNARAIIMVIGFASISVELRNPVIKSLLNHRGFANLYQALSLAFSALPFLISNRSKPYNKKSSYLFSLRVLLSQAETLLRVFEREHLKKPQIIIITGEVHEGKTTFAKKIIANLIDQKIRLAGFLSLARFENGNRTGFDLIDLETNNAIELCSLKKKEGSQNFGKYYFNNAAIKKGLDILNPDKLNDKQLIVIDEIGPLELNGQGWNSALDEITGRISVPQLWVVRKNILKKIVRRWNTGNVYIFDIKESSATEVENKILDLLLNGDKKKNQ
jgi:nucleoside-triphosphatase THEP1